ncbi:MAG: Ribosome maturation factor rimM [Gammaproteobacteria bacterium]|jgi:16S rRNA processing protein RimM|nr:Ribosome maturation factor rimM [Gammaproteobacteria bacterium]
MRAPEAKILAGKIGAPHGIKGWVKVFSYTSTPENLLNYQPWLLEIKGVMKSLKVLHAQPHGECLIVAFEGVTDRDQAAELTHTKIYIQRDQLPELAEDEYYWHDLEGVEVKNLEGFVFGRVDYLMNAGASDLMFIKGDKESCIPYRPGDVVKSVDLEKGEMIVDWPSEL